MLNQLHISHKIVTIYSHFILKFSLIIVCVAFVSINESVTPKLRNLQKILDDSDANNHRSQRKLLTQIRIKGIQTCTRIICAMSFLLCFIYNVVPFLNDFSFFNNGRFFFYQTCTFLPQLCSL